MEDFTPEGKALSRKLYRILTSYLKGPALSITRAVRQTENGFLVWQRLNAEYRSLSRQRGMALAQVLATYPAFPKDKSVMECVLALEEVVHQVVADGYLDPMFTPEPSTTSTTYVARLEYLQECEGNDVVV